MAAPKIPQNAAEMQALFFSLITQLAYQQVTLAARSKRLTEHDIELIERQIIDSTREEQHFAHEFTEFEAEPAVARARAEAKGYFAACRANRKKAIEG